MDCRFTLVHSGSSYLVRFTVEGQAAVEAPFEFDFSPTARIRGVIADIEQAVCRTDNLQDIGSQLWSALCPPSIRAGFDSAVATSSPPFRIWLEIPLDPAVDRLPWEALHDEREEIFLACDPRYCLLRVPARADKISTTVQPSVARAAPIRLLVLIPEGSGLQVQYEWANLRNIIQSLGDAATFELLEGRVTPDRLLDTLGSGTWDILHYIGHGQFDETEGVTIRLNHPTSSSDAIWMEAKTFAQLLAGSGLMLAVMNCCLGDAPAATRPLGGLGPHLTRTARIPAVIAMRYEIDNTAATRFADVFYRKLLGGANPGRVDIAAQAARMALLVNGRGSTVRAFVTPVLYLPPGQMQLFEVGPRAPAAIKPSISAGTPRSATIPGLSADLMKAVREGRCLPIVGPDIPGPAVRRAAAPGGFAELIDSLAKDINYPEVDELAFAQKAGDTFGLLLWPRLCQHYQQEKARYDLVLFLQEICRHREPSPALLSLASWNVPGIIYTHVDGMMEEALRRAGRQSQVVSFVDAPVGGQRITPRLVNLRGTLSDGKSLVLTETDHEELDDRLQRASSDVIDLLSGGAGRTLLFLGVSPRDPAVRKLCKLFLDAGEGTMQGKRYFVCPSPSAVDEAYWKHLQVKWIDAAPADVIESLSAVAGVRGAP